MRPCTIALIAGSLCHYSTQHHWAYQPERGRLGCRSGLQRPGCPPHCTGATAISPGPQRAPTSRPRRVIPARSAAAAGSVGVSSPGPRVTVRRGLPPAQPRGGASGQFRRSFKFPKARAPAAPPRASACGPFTSKLAGPGHEATSSQAWAGGTGWAPGQVRSGQVRSGQVRSGSQHPNPVSPGPHASGHYHDTALDFRVGRAMNLA